MTQKDLRGRVGMESNWHGDGCTLGMDPNVCGNGWGWI